MGTKPNDSQIALAEGLQIALLESFKKVLADGTATAADRAALARLLTANGWSLDPDKLPQGIRAFLPSQVDPKQFDEGDADLEVN